MLLGLACKNVLRYRHRTWVTIAAMAFAGCIMIFYASLLEGWLRAMEINAISMEMGEIQMHAPGYRFDPDLYNFISGAPAVLAEAGTAGFIGSSRLFGSGLAAAHENSTGVSIRGIDPDAEKQVVRLHVHIHAGRWLASGAEREVVLGQQLATILDVRPGDELVLIGQAADGSMANDLFIVRGVLKSVGQGIDRAGLFMTAKDFREFFVFPDGVHEFVFKRADRTLPLDEATESLTCLFPDHAVENWRQLQPTLARLLDLSDVSLVIMLLITYAAVGMLTMNAMLMGVFERIPVFGVMKALGFSGGRLFGLIIWETLIQVTAASLLALAAGLPLSLYFERNPIDFSFLLEGSSTIAGIAFEPQWYCEVTGSSILLPILFLYVVALLSISYPALKAAMISPVDAIRHT
ncbi:MAG: FtsX-like permease family protein [Desulfobulbaceae bacterium]|nr:FtsX-like permease family protein [Desulfobulbaceae bacterium]